MLLCVTGHFMRNFIAFLLLAVTGWAAKPNVLFIAVDDLAPALRAMET